MPPFFDAIVDVASRFLSGVNQSNPSSFDANDVVCRELHEANANIELTQSNRSPMLLLRIHHMLRTSPVSSRPVRLL